MNALYELLNAGESEPNQSPELLQEAARMAADDPASVQKMLSEYRSRGPRERSTADYVMSAVLAHLGKPQVIMRQIALSGTSVQIKVECGQIQTPVDAYWEPELQKIVVVSLMDPSRPTGEDCGWACYFEVLTNGFGTLPVDDSRVPVGRAVDDEKEIFYEVFFLPPREMT